MEWEAFEVAFHGNDNQRDREEILKHLTWLMQMWNAHQTDVQNSRDGTSVHAPPALEAVMTIILGNALPDTDLFELTKREGLEHDLATMSLAMSDVMFRFGQFCAQNGLLYANLNQCKCVGEAVTKAIDEILKDE